ncbi:MAG: uL15m family ribosomal protein [Thermomicrobiales bacterium]
MSADSRISFRRREVVNLGSLNGLDIDGPVTPEALKRFCLIQGTEFLVKVLATGDSRQDRSSRTRFSEAAKAAIEKNGGSAVVIERTDRWVTARPRNRRLAIDRDLKTARLGKVGGIERRSELASS